MKEDKRTIIEYLLYRICFVLTCVSALRLSWLYMFPYLLRPHVNLAHDIDWGYLNGGLAKIHSFNDTLSWWHGTWCGQVPFWRPITSYVFWTMRLLWQPGFFLPRQIILLALHICFVALAWQFLLVLTKRPWLSMFAILWFSGFLSFQPSDVLKDALYDPKNFPEPLTGLFILGSLLLTMKGKWVGGLILAACAVACKELGFVTWPLALIVLAWKRNLETGRNPIAGLNERVKANAVPVACWAVVLIGLGILHYASVGIGYRMGSNISWWARALSYLSGPILICLRTMDRGLAVTAIAVVAALKAPVKSLLVKFACVLTALACGIAVASYSHGVDIAVATTEVLYVQGDIVLRQIIWLLVGLLTLRDMKTVLPSFLCCAVAASPVWMASQTLMHTLYLAQLFMSLLVTAAWAQVFLHIRKNILPVCIDCIPGGKRISGSPGL